MLTLTTVLVALVGAVTLISWQQPAWQEGMILDVRAIRQGRQVHRLVTSMFIHADWMHLFVNGLTLYFFGTFLESAYLMLGISPFWMLAVFLAGGITGGLYDVWQYRGGHFRSLGASGGVSAVLFASVALAPTQPICLYFALCIPGDVFAPLYLVYTVYMARQASDSVNHYAHFVGALAGLLIQFFLTPQAILGLIDALPF